MKKYVCVYPHAHKSRDPSKRGLHDILTGSATTESIILHTTQAEVIAADVRCRQIAEAIRRARAVSMERHKLEKQITQQTTTENELLRKIVRQQAARIADLETYLKKKS